MRAQGPQSGEVWGCRGSVCLVTYDNALINIETGMLIHNRARYLYEYGEVNFLAPDLAAYFKARRG